MNLLRIHITCICLFSNTMHEKIKVILMLNNSFSLAKLSVL